MARGMAMVIKVKGDRDVRAITYLSNGQRCECWLPTGYWKIEGEVNLDGGRALRIGRPAPLLWAGTHYVSLSAFDKK